jgi:hypothetical protein
MDRKVRAIIVDGTEIMTSYTAVEIADRLRTYDDLKKEIEELKDWNKKLIRDDLEYVNKSFEQNRYKSRIDKATSLYLKELSEKGKVDDLACKMFNALEGNVK